MNKLVKSSLRPVYTYITDYKIRELYRLERLLKKQKRYHKIENFKFLDYNFDIPDFASFVGQYREIFVHEIFKFNSTNVPPVIVDCGSNIGMSLLYFSKLHPNARIIGIEADKKIAEICKTNIVKNKIANITLIEKAAWINTYGIMFSSDGADGGTIFSEENSVKIETIRLKDLLEKEMKIDFLKIDIEGAEYEVLNDCRNSLSHVDKIFIETHSFNNKPQNLSLVFDILESNGFRYYIDNEARRTIPFINNGKEKVMDLQMTIFGYK